MSKEKYIHERYKDIKESIGGNYGFFEIGFNFGLECADQQTKLLTEQLSDLQSQLTLSEAQLTARKLDVKELKEQLDKYKSIAESESVRVDNLQDQLSQKVFKLQASDHALAEKEKDIKYWQDEVDHWNKQAVEMGNKLAEKEKELSEVKKLLVKYLEQLEKEQEAGC